MMTVLSKQVLRCLAASFCAVLLLGLLPTISGFGSLQGIVRAQKHADAKPTNLPSGTMSEEADDAVTLRFYHAMGGANGVILQGLVDRYNASQNDVFVQASFEGSYEQTFDSLIAALAAGDPPNVVQNFDLATQQTLDAIPILPLHELMEADGYSPDVFIPAVRDYYSTVDGMAAMAFNSSTPLLYFNNDLFQAAGIAPPGTDWTFADLSAKCQQLQQAQGAPNCVAFGTVGWFFEQILANSGGLYFDRSNGRAGRAQSVRFNQGQGLEVFSELIGLIQNGYAPDLGADWGAPNDAFINQQVAMLIASSSNVRSIQDSASFTVGTTYIPHSNSSARNGVVVGGAALWMIDVEDIETNAAAWDFMKFLAAPQQQSDWHRETGYIPVRADLLQNAGLISFWDANPNFKTAIDQLLTTQTERPDQMPNYAVLGGRSGPFPEIRQRIVSAYRSVLGEGRSVTEALDEAAQQANVALSTYRVTATSEIPTTGAELAFLGNNMHYAFASGTFSETAVISYEIGFPDPPLGGALLGIGTTFDVSVAAGVAAASVTPSQPYTMSVRYTDAQLASIAEDTLAFYYLDGEEWIKELSSYVDPGNQMLTANPNHFSRWTVAGEGEHEQLFLPLIAR